MFLNYYPPRLPPPEDLELPPEDLPLLPDEDLDALELLPLLLPELQVLEDFALVLYEELLLAELLQLELLVELLRTDDVLDVELAVGVEELADLLRTV